MRFSSESKAGLLLGIVLAVLGIWRPVFNLVRLPRVAAWLGPFHVSPYPKVYDNDLFFARTYLTFRKDDEIRNILTVRELTQHTGRRGLERTFFHHGLMRANRHISASLAPDLRKIVAEEYLCSRILAKQLNLTIPYEVGISTENLKDRDFEQEWTVKCSY